ncbi:hypothetical protein [Yersinia vastinensis]|uniref:hypothetical protein n=1 Tax=Yersinia vastinensis TaxID=2890318 RepID=UPI0011A0859A|nr:hypothetical protein [Yersinia vastinensis]
MQAAQVSQYLIDLVANTRKHLSRAESDLAETRHQQLVIKQRIATTYQQIASLLLQDNGAANDIEMVQDLLDKLQLELSQTQQALQHSENDILRQLAQVETLRKQIVPLEHEREQLLQQNPEAIAARRDMVQLYSEANQQKINHSELLVEADVKLTEYLNQPIFMFLMSKNYGQPDYHRGPISRNLDSWLARHINYTNNFANYLMLQALPKESERRLQILQHQSEKRTSEYLNYLTEIEEKIHLPPRYQQLESLEKALVASQQEARNLQEKLQQYSLGESETFARIATQLSAQMAMLPLDRLDTLVAKTATPDDDRLLEELRGLKRMEVKLAETQHEEEHAIASIRPRASAAAILASTFINSRLNDSRYEYIESRHERFEDLFERFLNGSISLELVFKQLNMARQDSDVPTATGIIATLAVEAILANRRSARRSSGSSSSGEGFSSSSTSSSAGRGSGSSSSSGGGGFSSSSSTGGGGFRSTDSF